MTGCDIRNTLLNYNCSLRHPPPSKTETSRLYAITNRPQVIGRDIGRTFPEHWMFTAGAPGLQLLGRLLRAYALRDEEVGYCQGMGEVLVCAVCINFACAGGRGAGCARCGARRSATARAWVSQHAADTSTSKLKHAQTPP